MKFAQCNYSKFESSKLGLNLNAGDIFVVDSRIENSPSFKEGLSTNNFKLITPSVEQLGKIKGMTPEIEMEFRASIKDKTPEPTPVAQLKEKTPEPTPQPEVKETEEIAEEENPSGLVFTEEAGNVANALKLVAVETDIEKLKMALRQDERKSVKKAIVQRLKELQG